MSLSRAQLGKSAAVAAVVFLAHYFPDRDDGSGAIVGGVLAFAAVAIGLAAVAHARPLPHRSWTERVRLSALSLFAGVALGSANLLANFGIASLDARIHQRMIEQWARFSAWSAVFASPLVEEIGFRLFLMGGTAWLVSRMTNDRRLVFLAALSVSAPLFGVAHLLRPTTGVVHATGVALKNCAAGLALGWVFWRWGLPYSIACHGIANAVHLLAWRAVF